MEYKAYDEEPTEGSEGSSSPLGSSGSLGDEFDPVGLSNSPQLNDDSADEMEKIRRRNQRSQNPDEAVVGEDENVGASEKTAEEKAYDDMADGPYIKPTE